MANCVVMRLFSRLSLHGASDFAFSLRRVEASKDVPIRKVPVRLDSCQSVVEMIL